MAVATLKAVFKAATGGFEAGVKRVNKGLEKARQRSDQTKGSMDSLGSTMGKMAAGLGLSVGLGILAQKFFATNLEVEKLKASLVTITGTVTGAEGAFNELMETASTTPFALQEVTDSFIKLTNYGLKPTQDAMKDYGNIASAMGKTLNQVSEGIADAVQGEWERMKEFGFKAKQEGDRVKIRFGGVTTDIGNNAAEIQAYLRGISKEKFGDAMERQMATMGGAMSNLGDNVTRLFVALGEAGINEFIGDMIRSTSDMVAALAGWESGLTAVGNAIAFLIPLMAGGVAGLIAFKAWVILSTGAVWSMVVALQAMKGALIATGIGMFVVALGMLLPKLWEWITASSRQAEASKKQAQETKRLREETKQMAEEAQKQAKITQKQIKLEQELAKRKKDITQAGIIDHYKTLTDEIDTYNEAQAAMIALKEAEIDVADHVMPLTLQEFRNRGKIVHVLSEEAKALLEVKTRLKAVADAAHAASAAGIAEGFAEINKEVENYKTAMEGINTKIEASIELTTEEQNALTNLRGNLSEGAEALLVYMDAQKRLNEEKETAAGWLDKEIRAIETQKEEILVLNELIKKGVDVTRFLTEAQKELVEAGVELTTILTPLQEALQKVREELEKNKKETEETTDTWKTTWAEAWKDLKKTFAGILVYGVTRVLGGMVDMLFSANRGWKQLGALVKDIGKQLLKMALNAAIMKLLNVIGGKVFGGGGTLGMIGKWFGFGAKAEGGIISEPTALLGMHTGKTGIMSERGAEYIVPMHKMGRMAGAGGGVNVTINVHGSVGVDNIASEIVGSLRRHGLS